MERAWERKSACGTLLERKASVGYGSRYKAMKISKNRSLFPGSHNLHIGAYVYRYG